MTNFQHHVDRALTHLVDENDEQARIIQLAKLRDEARALDDEPAARGFQRRVDQARDRRRIALSRARVHGLLAIAYALRGDQAPTPRDLFGDPIVAVDKRATTYPGGPSYRLDPDDTRS